MNIDYYSKSDVLTAEVKEHISERLEKINQHIPRESVRVRVRVDKDQASNSGNVFLCDITMHVPGKDFHAAVNGQSVHEAIDLTIQKIKRQAEKYKSVMQEKHR